MTASLLVAIFCVLFAVFAAVLFVLLLRYKAARDNSHATQQDFFRLVELLPFGIAIEQGAVGTTIYHNAADFAIFGYGLNEFEDIEEWLDKIYPDPAYRLEVDDQLVAMMAEGVQDPKHGSRPKVFTVVTKGGIKKQVQFHYIPFNDLHIWVEADVTELHVARENLQRLSKTDPLTGLGNRLALEDRLQDAIHRAKRNASKFAILFIDLDQFRQVNEMHGHKVGDMVLVAIAKRIHAMSRGVDSAIRLGGDEFVLIVDEVETEAAAQAVAARLREVICAPVRISDFMAISPAASIGVALYPEAGSTMDEIIHYADTRMYAIKKQGRL